MDYRFVNLFHYRRLKYSKMCYFPSQACFPLSIIQQIIVSECIHCINIHSCVRVIISSDHKTYLLYSTMSQPTSVTRTCFSYHHVCVSCSPQRYFAKLHRLIIFAKIDDICNLYVCQYKSIEVE